MPMDRRRFRRRTVTTCGGDLRECLRLSAKAGIYGARYVVADDVARCVEAFDACIHGTLHGGNPNRPPSTSAQEGSETTLPKHFRITFDTTAMDCRTNGNAVTCTSTRQEDLPNGTGTHSETGQLSGTVSGLTIVGTMTRHGRSEAVAGCNSTQELAGPARYDFDSDGSVRTREGPIKQNNVFSGICADLPPTSDTYPAWEGTATWSAIG